VRPWIHCQSTLKSISLKELSAFFSSILIVHWEKRRKRPPFADISPPQGQELASRAGDPPPPSRTRDVSNRQEQLLRGLQRPKQYSDRVWTLINKYRGNTQVRPALLQVAQSLEEHTFNLVLLCTFWDSAKISNGLLAGDSSLSPALPDLLSPLISFYNHPRISPKWHSFISLAEQLLSKSSQKIHYKNSFSALFSEEDQTDNPKIEELQLRLKMTPLTTASNPVKLKWTADASVAKLSETILKDLQVDADKMQEEGEDIDDNPKYQNNIQDPSPEVKVNQLIRFNLIHHRNSDSSIPTLKLFKSFTSALRSLDQFLLILPVNSTKQNLPALSNVTQINSTDQNRMLTYFKPYFNKQQYSLSGYFHVSSSLSLQELMASSSVYEWLEIKRYAIKQSPSNSEEMVQIGALCFSSEYIYREDPKMAITKHPSWSFPTLLEPPIIHLTKGDFQGLENSTKMIFVCSEWLTQVEVRDFFSKLYDGTSKD